MSGFLHKARINQKQTTQQQMLGPEPSYEVTLDFPLPERQRLALYLVRHLGGLNVALQIKKNGFKGKKRNEKQHSHSRVSSLTTLDAQSYS